MLFSACGKNIVFDVGFAIDGSNSIDDNEYRLTKDFVKDVIRIFTISEQSTHVALLEYASEASIKVYFDDDDYYQADKLLERVEQLTQAQGASTNIGRGLEKTLGMFSADYGMREKVGWSHQIIDLFTVFSTFYMDQLGKIRRHHWKGRLKISKMVFGEQVAKMYRRLFGGGQACVPHHTNVCKISRLWGAVYRIYSKKRPSRISAHPEGRKSF